MGMSRFESKSHFETRIFRAYRSDCQGPLVDLLSCCLKTVTNGAVILITIMLPCFQAHARGNTVGSLPVVNARFLNTKTAGSGDRFASFKLEVARSPAQRDAGLMFREAMPTDAGMLFIFADDQPRSFWMKNTLIPLDIIFVDSSGIVVTVIENAAPMTLTERKCAVPARYVIELNAFTAARSGVVPGSVVVFNPSLDLL